MVSIPSFAGMMAIPMGEPTEEQKTASRARHAAHYEMIKPFLIDQWPASVMALSFPTRMVQVDPADMKILYDYEHPEWKAQATLLASRLDDILDWERHFIRLNSRSPKDAADSLITCSGRQAVDWITTSERCLDDTVMFLNADRPVYVCLRESRFMDPDGEFRCFARNGEVVAVSRYFHRTAPVNLPEPGSMLAAARRFYDTHLRDLYPDVVFDLYSPGYPDEVLIEINPYGLSDPCMFEGYAEIEAIGGERLGQLEPASDPITDNEEIAS